MLRLTATALVSLFITSSLSLAENRDLILVAGQSNAVGYDGYRSELPLDDADKDVMFWWRCGDPPPDAHDSTGEQRWTVLQPQPLGNPLTKDSGEPGEVGFGLTRQYGNFARPDGGFGVEMGLAREWQSTPHPPLSIVKVAFSGTALRTDWNPNDEGAGSACFRALVDETGSAIAAAKAVGIELRLRAIVWVQGESDANQQDAPLYEQRLTRLIEAIRNRLEMPDLIVLVGVNTRFLEARNQFMPQIVAAQRAVAEKDSRCVYVDTASAEVLLPNAVHFTSAGTLDVGRRFAKELLKFESER